MCRNADSWGFGSFVRAARRAAVALACVLLVAGGASAQPSDEVFVLEPETRRQLVELQETWIEWLTQIQLGEIEDANQLIELILSEAAILGMKELPDLAAAAATQATSFTKAAEHEKAEAATGAAERLQPGLPLAAFASADLARSRGQLLRSFWWWGRGVARILTHSDWQRVTLANLAHWLMVVAALTAFSFVGLLMASHGSLLLRDLVEFIRRSVPLLAAYVLASVLLLWPAMLPAGLLWLALYWSVLLWGYGSLGERIALVVLWLLLGGLPILVSEHVRRFDLAISAPMRAVDNAAVGRLEGSLFSDLGVAIELLPESHAVKHLQADLHLKMRQWELARGLYREVLVGEGDNVAALADLGAVSFYEGDLDSAVQYLQQAANAGTVPAQVYFNLSRAFSEQYRFSESEAMLRRANSLDSEGVGRWIAHESQDQIVAVFGGRGRRGQIRKELAEVWQADGDRTITSAWRRMLSLPLALVLLGPAVGVFLLARRSRLRLPSSSDPWFDGPVERLRATILPGLVEAEKRQPIRAWCSLGIVLGLLTIPLAGSYGFALPLGRLPMLALAPVIAIGGTAIYLVVRWFRSGGRQQRS